MARNLQAREALQARARDLDDILCRHSELSRQLRSYEDRCLQLANVEAELAGVRLRAEAAARAATEKALEDEEEKGRLIAQVGLLEKKLRAQEETTGARLAAQKEELLKSEEFETLCSAKSVIYFEQGFQGCLKQFRDNGYAEAEHPAPFLDVDKALEDMPEEGEIPEVNMENQGLGDEEVAGSGL